MGVTIWKAVIYNLVMETEVYSVVSKEEGCSTPKHSGYRIPTRDQPPPPPRKKPFYVCGEKRETPKKGYFHPPDLDHVFVTTQPHEVWV
ncbi:cyclin-dependent kinase inhibitor SMR4 [Olea europaea subsp. europaea]|uniref:Cyclin-dependent kinase inhibitor SMR4 n=1 Tax=Olea europaea subsp. europaea TaxID=158383 RepID=A0A8S0SJL5_OLEEU|nr:cyclin-dependent kinase inhibitor SMR4 [Olea europaea subsp. europaea]